ncbi:MAG TPA: YqgE/AlgH family protein [Acidimicrobiia bacterium]
MIGTPLKGRLLVASPALRDPNFDRTIVLVLEHSDEGALGLVLNRPSDTELADTLPEWGPLAVDPGVVFVGGPVSPDSAIGLALSGGDAAGGIDGAVTTRDGDHDGEELDASTGWIPLFGPLGTVDLGRDPDDVQPGVRAVRVFVGYAGWAAGQLESELAAGGWFVVDADVRDALDTDPDGLWRTVLRRQRGALSWLANFPEDPTAN